LIYNSIQIHICGFDSNIWKYKIEKYDFYKFEGKIKEVLLTQQHQPDKKRRDYRSANVILKGKNSKEKPGFFQPKELKCNAMNKKVAIYTRVSKESGDFQRQVDELSLFANQQGYDVVEVISEKISGGKKMMNVQELLS
jgi:beta-xylosidase